MVLPLDAATHSSQEALLCVLLQQKEVPPDPHPLGCQSSALCEHHIFCKRKYFFLFLGKGLNKDTTLAARGVRGVLSPPPLAEQLHPLLQSLIRDPNPF